MKKLIALLLVGLMLAGGVIAVNAEEPLDRLGGKLPGETQGIGASRVQRLGLTEFVGEIHRVNQLRMEENRLKAQLIEKNDRIIDLMLSAREEGNKEALASVKAEREKLKEINADIKSLHEQAAAAREAFRSALRAGDSDTATAELEKLLNAHSLIKDKMESKLQLLDNIIALLS